MNLLASQNDKKNYGSKWSWKQLMICEKKVVGFTVYMVRGKYYTV